MNYNKMLAEVLEVSNAGAPHPIYGVEDQLRIILDNHMREFIRTKAQLALRSIEHGTVALRVNYAA